VINEIPELRRFRLELKLSPRLLRPKTRYANNQQNTTGNDERREDSYSEDHEDAFL